MKPSEVKKEVKRIQAVVAQINGMQFDDPNYKNADNKLWEMIEALDAKAGPGLVPGRHIKFGVADGYAHYIITKVNKTTIDVEHLPYMDAYHFMGVYEGKIMAGIAARQLGWQDGMKELFSKKQTA